MLILILLIVIFHTFCCAKKNIWGLSSLIGIKILIPNYVRAIILPISLNTLCIIILFLFIFINKKDKKSSISKGYITYLEVFILILFITTILSFPISLTTQLGYLFQFLITDVSLGILAALTIKSYQDVKVIMNVILLSSSFACILGIYQFITYSNVYISYFENYFNPAFDTDAYLDSAMGGRLGGIAGTCSDSLIWGRTIPALLGITYAYYKRTKKSILILLIIALLINSILSMRRSSVVAVLFYFFTIWLFSSFKEKTRIFKYIMISIICIYASFILIPFLNQFLPFIETSIFFWNDNIAADNDIKGSSLSMRLEQLNYAFKMIETNPILGLGYGYTNYYSKYHGYHPQLLGFESILFHIIINSGILGLIYWNTLFYKIYKYCSKYSCKTYIAAFLLSVLTSAYMTDYAGTWGYLFIFPIIIMKMYSKNSEQSFNLQKVSFTKQYNV